MNPVKHPQKQMDVPATVSLSLAMVLWASSFIALKIAFQYYDPMVVMFGRMATASLCFLAFIPGFRGKISYRKGDIRLLLLMALSEPCVYFVLEAKAIENTTVSQAGMITAMLPLMVAVAAFFVLREHLTSKAAGGFAIAVLGACGLSIAGESSAYAPHPAFGNFLEFLAMACATVYTILLKRLSERYPPLFLTAMQAVVGMLFFGAILFLPSTRLPTSFEPVPVISIVYLGAFISLGAYGLYSYGVSRIPAGQACAFINLIPALTLFFAWLILRERLTPLQYIASLVVFVGVWVSQTGGVEKKS